MLTIATFRLGSSHVTKQTKKIRTKMNLAWVDEKCMGDSKMSQLILSKIYTSNEIFDAMPH